MLPSVGSYVTYVVVLVAVVSCLLDVVNGEWVAHASHYSYPLSRLVINPRDFSSWLDAARRGVALVLVNVHAIMVMTAIYRLSVHYL